MNKSQVKSVTLQKYFPLPLVQFFFACFETSAVAQAAAPPAPPGRDGQRGAARHALEPLRGPPRRGRRRRGAAAEHLRPPRSAGAGRRPALGLLYETKLKLN